MPSISQKTIRLVETEFTDHGHRPTSGSGMYDQRVRQKIRCGTGQMRIGGEGSEGDEGGETALT